MRHRSIFRDVLVGGVAAIAVWIPQWALILFLVRACR